MAEQESRPGGAQKGRGAISNPHNRYAPRSTQAVDDGWDIEEEEAPKLKTTVLRETAKTIISTNRSPDIPFDQSINPYRGCEHGCIYCYARPSHAYWDLSPGLDFESKIIVKENAAELLRETLSKPGYRVSPISIGANTDPYQPLEAKLKITRSIIEVLHEFNHPFSMITKSDLITRDLDLLAPMAQKRLFTAAVSVTTLDNKLKRILEPRATAGKVRLNTIAALHEAGIKTSMLVAPVIPFVNDHELEDILAAGRKAGASAAHYVLLRLPLEISDMFQEWLAEHFPDRAGKVMSVVRESRGGKDYRSEFGVRMRGTGEFAKLLAQRFAVTARKLGLRADDRYTLDTSQFIRKNEQLSLF